MKFFVFFVAIVLATTFAVPVPDSATSLDQNILGTDLVGVAPELVARLLDLQKLVSSLNINDITGTYNE